MSQIYCPIFPLPPSGHVASPMAKDNPTVCKLEHQWFPVHVVARVHAHRGRLIGEVEEWNVGGGKGAKLGGKKSAIKEREAMRGEGSIVNGSCRILSPPPEATCCLVLTLANFLVQVQGDHCRSGGLHGGKGN